jgi:hypothetical protein
VLPAASAAASSWLKGSAVATSTVQSAFHTSRNSWQATAPTTAGGEAVAARCDPMCIVCKHRIRSLLGAVWDKEGNDSVGRAGSSTCRDSIQRAVVSTIDVRGCCVWVPWGCMYCGELPCHCTTGCLKAVSFQPTKPPCSGQLLRKPASAVGSQFSSCQSRLAAGALASITRCQGSLAQLYVPCWPSTRVPRCA